MTKILALFDLVPAWLYAAAIVFLLGLYSIQWTTNTTRIAALKSDVSSAKADVAAAEKAHSDYVAEQARINKEAADKAREREQQLQADANTFRNNAYAQINRLTRERDAALDSLRNRPERPAANAAGVPSTAGPGSEARHCTGADLYRDDAAFLVRLSADYKELGIRYDELWSLYQRARAGAQGAKEVKAQP
jgi:hypothetical protein